MSKIALRCVALAGGVLALAAVPAHAASVSITGPPTGITKYYLDDGFPASATADTSGCPAGQTIFLNIWLKLPNGIVGGQAPVINETSTSGTLDPSIEGVHEWWGEMACGGQHFLSEVRTIVVTRTRAPVAPLPRPKPPAATPNCDNARTSQEIATASYNATAFLAGGSALLVGADVLLPPSVIEHVLGSMKNALPSPGDLISHVESHASRAAEQGSWQKPTGTAAQKAAQAQQQINEVLNAADRRMQTFTNAQGQVAVEIMQPPSAANPKGRALRFIMVRGKLVFKSLGVFKVLTFARAVESVALIPAAATGLLAAGITATVSASAQAVAGVQTYLCKKERKKARVSAAVSDVAAAAAALPSLPTAPTGLGLSPATAREGDALAGNLAAQAASARALRKAVAGIGRRRGSKAKAAEGRARRQAGRLAALVGAEPGLRGALARTPEFSASITVHPFAPTPADESAALGLLRPGLRRLNAPAAALKLARDGFRQMAATGRRFTLGELLVDPALDAHDRDTAAVLAAFAAGS
jgi:hypothetical protein